MARSRLRQDAFTVSKLSYPPEISERSNAAERPTLIDPLERSEVLTFDEGGPTTPVHELQRMLVDRLAGAAMYDCPRRPEVVADIAEASIQFVSRLVGPVLFGLSAWGVLAFIF